MRQLARETTASRLIVLAAILVIGVVLPKPASALTDFMYFTVNGDSSLTALTQGDTLSWAANCDTGSTVWWEVWYDVNTNSLIDPGTDAILGIISITDGDQNMDADGAKNGWVQFPDLVSHLHPGVYLFKGIDWSDETTIQGSATCAAMASPPNTITGTVTLEGVTPPNAALANIIVWADIDGPSAQTGMTDNSGYYEINIGPWGTGVTFEVQPSSVDGFPMPARIQLVASGVTSNVNFHFAAPVDSVYGYLRSPEGPVRNIRGMVLARTTSGGWAEKEDVSEAGRYAINFGASDLGDWELGVDDEQFIPAFLIPAPVRFSHDTLNSFRRDFTLYRPDTVLYVRIVENGGLPSAPYVIDVWSSALSCRTRAISGIGADNVVEVGVSSWDMSNWNTALDASNGDYPLPPGLIWDGVSPSGLAPGDTATLNLIGGIQASGTILLDAGDPPPVWDDVWVSLWESEAKNFSARPDGSGFFTVTASAGAYWMNAWRDGYLFDPQGRNVTITGDTSGLDFTMNHAHCRVTGTLVNIPTPLNSSGMGISASTSPTTSEYYGSTVWIDSATATYEFYLCDGEWTIWPAYFDGYNPPAEAVFTVGEYPDTVRVVDLVYTPTGGGCAVAVTGDVNNNGEIVSSDIIYLVNYVLRAGPEPLPCPAAGDVNCNGSVVAADIIYLVNHVFRAGPAPCDVCSIVPGVWSCP